RRRAADAADQNCRPSTGTAEGKDRSNPVRKIIPSDRRSVGETRANDSILESARIFDVVALQQLWRGARMSELQRRAHLSPPHGEVELSSLRTYRDRSEKMSSLRQRRADLRRVRHRKSGVDRVAIFSKSECAPDGRRFHDAQRRLSRDAAKLSFGQDRHPRGDANDREGPPFP